MYHKSGDFGEVRLKTCLQPVEMSGLDYSSSLGWHKCNDLYHISRCEGAGSALLMLTVGGKGQLNMNGKSQNLYAGTIAVIPMNMPHEYFTQKDLQWEFYWIHMSGENCGRLIELLIAKKGFVFKVYDYFSLAKYFEKLTTTDYGYEDMSIRMSCSISVILFSVLLSKKANASEKISISKRVEDYLRQNYRKRISTRDIARELYMSEEYLIRAYKKEAGITPSEALKRIRLLKAVNLLLCTGHSVNRIALDVGYSSVGWFIKQFKEYNSLTPEAYRKEMQSHCID